MDQVFTLDQALENLNKIIAHVTLEQDLKIKGEQIGNGWTQLKCIKDVVLKLDFFQRRSFKKIIIPQETRLKYLEDNFISEVELDLILSDCQKLTSLVSQFEKMTKYQRDESHKSIIQLKDQLEAVVKKNYYRVKDPKWKKILIESSDLIKTINDFLLAQTDLERRKSTNTMNQMLQTIRREERMIDEEEEELLQIIVKLEELRLLQANINLQVNEQGDQMGNLEKNGSTINNNDGLALKDYSAANEFVKMRRRTKIKLFFVGLFTAIGSLGGKIGALFGASVGAGVGSKAAKTLVKKQNTL